MNSIESSALKQDIKKDLGSPLLKLESGSRNSNLQASPQFKAISQDNANVIQKNSQGSIFSKIKTNNSRRVNLNQQIEDLNNYPAATEYQIQVQVQQKQSESNPLQIPQQNTINNANNNQKRRGKFSTFANIQEKLKAIEAEYKNKQAVQKQQLQQDQGILELPKVKVVDGDLKKYEGKIYEDADTGVIKIEQRTGQINLDDLNIQRKEQGFMDKIKEKKEVNSNHLQLPQIKNGSLESSILKSDHSSVLSPSQRNISSPYENTHRSVILREPAKPAIQYNLANSAHKGSQITLSNKIQIASQTLNKNESVQERQENKLQVQKKLEKLKSKLTAAGNTDRDNVDLLFLEKNNLLYQSLNYKQSEEPSQLITEEDSDSDQEEILSPNKVRRIKLLESIHENPTINEILNAQSQKKNPAINRYKSHDKLQPLPAKVKNNKLTAADFADQLDSLESNFEMSIQNTPSDPSTMQILANLNNNINNTSTFTSTMNNSMIGSNSTSKLLPSIQSQKIDQLFNYRNNVIQNSKDKPKQGANVSGITGQRKSLFLQQTNLVLNSMSMNTIKRAKFQVHKLYLLQKGGKTLSFDLVNDEVRIFNVKKYAESIKQPSTIIENNGILVMTGGINTESAKVSHQAHMIDTQNERVIEMADMLEPKYKHKTIYCNNKIFALGGYINISQSSKSQTIQRYDVDLNKWFVCNPMKFGHAGEQFYVIANNISHYLYVFGGCDNPDNSKTIEKYDSILDVWISLNIKLPSKFLNRPNQIFYLSSPSDALHQIIFGQQDSDDRSDKIIHIDQDKTAKQFLINSLHLAKAKFLTNFKLEDLNSQQNIWNARIQGECLFVLREGIDLAMERFDLTKNVGHLSKLKFNQKEDLKARVLGSDDSTKFLSPVRNSHDNLFKNMNSPAKSQSPKDSFNQDSQNISSATTLPSINNIFKFGNNNSSTFGLFNVKNKLKEKQQIREDQL
ncbi:kelch motif family protein [Stylonychia lemnae]|uniref:Kelch motif family protein n=1 Tax=Stylonychia lemnae TaxID=5949 RepID=A0A078AHY9_STYLE|nr:kelch motif family protein [Stylonychia lemnae]|eukprot:CDW80398.1 kelch motif family protein [Stylonychia lemnae]